MKFSISNKKFFKASQLDKKVEAETHHQNPDFMHSYLVVESPTIWIKYMRSCQIESFFSKKSGWNKMLKSPAPRSDIVINNSWSSINDIWFQHMKNGPSLKTYTCVCVGNCVPFHFQGISIGFMRFVGAFFRGGGKLGILGVGWGSGNLRGTLRNHQKPYKVGPY